MKKIISLALSFCMLIFSGILGFSGCDNKNVIRLNEVTHSIFYAPLYVAINLGYMKDEKIEIKLTNGGGSDVSMTALLTNSADIALLGPETVVYVANQGSTNHPMIFGQLTKRDGSFLVGRSDEPTFNWLNLAGKHIIAGRRGGMPAMTLQYVLNSKGYDIEEDLNFDLSVAFNLVGPTFAGGAGDYCTMFEPAATALADEAGYIVASVGAESGEIPFTCFMAMPKYLKKNPEKIKGFLRAITKAYTYMQTHTSLEVAQALKKSFPDSSTESLRIAVEAYIAIDAWSNTPAMTTASFSKLLAVLTNAGELTSNTVKFTDVVDNSFAYSI